MKEEEEKREVYRCTCLYSCKTIKKDFMFAIYSRSFVDFLFLLLN